MDAMDYMGCLNVAEAIAYRLCMGDALAPEGGEVFRWQRSYRGNAGQDDAAILAGLSYARDALARYLPGDPLLADADGLLARLGQEASG